jgi:hypothetical protein
VPDEWVIARFKNTACVLPFVRLTVLLPPCRNGNYQVVIFLIGRTENDIQALAFDSVGHIQLWYEQSLSPEVAAQCLQDAQVAFLKR